MKQMKRKLKKRSGSNKKNKKKCAKSVKVQMKPGDLLSGSSSSSQIDPNEESKE